MEMLATAIDRTDGYIAEMHRLRLTPLVEMCNMSVLPRLLLNHLDVCKSKVSLLILSSKGWSDSYHATPGPNQSPLLADPTLRLLLSPPKRHAVVLQPRGHIIPG